MDTSSCPAGPLFRDLLHGALLHEEQEICSIGVPAGPPEHFLSSVSCAPELSIGYLVRKEALQRRIPIESERHYAASQECVDFCLVDDRGACTPSLEIKGPSGVWDRSGPLQADVLSILALL